MIRIGQIQLSLYLKDKLPFDEEKLNSIKSAISNYKYPAGIIADDLLTQNTLYENATLTENVEYLSTIFNFLFQDIYSSQEIDIIIAYLISCSYDNFVFDTETKAYFYPFIQLQSEKPEIQYYIDEIKYHYLLSLIYSHSTQEEKVLINILSEQLSTIEEKHNTFAIHAQLL